MRDALEIRKLRCSKGFFSQQSIADALREHGISITRQTYHRKEHGEIPFSAKELKAMVEILGITAEEGIDFFS